MATVVLLPYFNSLLDPHGGKIVNGVTANGIDISGLTKSQAIHLLEDSFENDISKNDMIIKLPDTEIVLSPKNTGASIQLNSLVDAAYCVGRTDSSKQEFSLSSYLTVNEDYIRSQINSYADQLGTLYSPTEYQIEGDIPSLEENSINESTPAPVLVLHTGVSGATLNPDELYQQVIEAYLHGSLVVHAENSVQEKKPEPLNLEQIQEDIGIAPKDAAIDKATKQVIPASYGLSFDVSEAAALVSKAGQNESIRIPMEYSKPDILGQEVYFQDILGFCQTPHGNNENRNTNLRLATATLNGVVLQPGDTLSYNETLGKRTAENGYLPAPAYSGTQLIDSIGGGICQVSSTLYLCSIYAGLETVDRVSHGYPVSYIPAGLDATVSWGAPDLKIRNDSEYPVKIVAEENDGFVRVWIMGTETRDYYIRAGYSSGGSYAKSYICKYDRKTDEFISKEEHRLSGYLDDFTSVIGEIGSNEAYINGNVRVQDPCSPTEKTLEASRNYSAPNTHAE